MSEWGKFDGMDMEIEMGVRMQYLLVSDDTILLEEWNYDGRMLGLPVRVELFAG